MLQKQKNITPDSKNIEVPKWAPIAVLVITAIIYIKALQNDFAGLDDDKYILLNPLIKNFSIDGIKTIFSSFYASNYHPFVFLSFLVEYKLFGLSPLPYHLFNVLLHLLNVWLVFKLSEQLSGKKMTALIVSLLFAVHPMHVESVAWITERKDVLYSLFYLLSLLVYLKYCNSGFRIKYYFGVLLLFTASLFSKSAAVTLPVLLIAIDIYRGRKINFKLVVEKIPFFIVSLIFGVLAVMSQKSGEAVLDISQAYGFIARIFLLTYAIAFYIVKFVTPFNLSAMHYYPEYSGTLPWQYYASLPFLLLIGWLLMRKSSFRKEIIFGLLLFLITISVMLQIFPVGRTITSERYSYVPYIGLFYIVGQYISGIPKDNFRKVVFGMFSLFVIVFSIQTWNRIDVWKNGETLFTDVIKKYPDNYDAYCMRGIQKSNGGKPLEAIEDYNKAIRLNPNNSFEPYYDRGRAYYQLDSYRLAIEDYNKAILLKPDAADTYDDRGRAHYESGNTNLALEDYNKAIRLKPEWAESYNGRGLVYNDLNNITAALLDFNKAIRLQPEQAELYVNRGLAYSKSGDVTLALNDFNKAILLNPDLAEAYTNRCLIKIKTKDINGAIEDINKAITLMPKSGENYGYRGILKVMQNNFKEAIEDFGYSLKLKPGEAKVYFNRGVARLSLKDTIGACTDWKIARTSGHEKAAAQLKVFGCE